MGLVVALGAASVTLAIPAAGAQGFQPLLSPQRLLDTRVGAPTADGQFAGIGVRPAGATLRLPVAGRAGIPTDATTAVLSVTVDQALEDGYVTVYPCDADRPNASNLNYTPGITRANAVITRLDAQGQVCLYTYGSTSPGGWPPAASARRRRPPSITASKSQTGPHQTHSGWPRAGRVASFLS